MKKSTTVDKRFSMKKFSDSMIGAFLIVSHFLRKAIDRPASDMTCFTDIYLRVKRTEHKQDIRHFVICAKAV